MLREKVTSFVSIEKIIIVKKTVFLYNLLHHLPIRFPIHQLTEDIHFISNMDTIEFIL